VLHLHSPRGLLRPAQAAASDRVSKSDGQTLDSRGDGLFCRATFIFHELVVKHGAAPGSILVIRHSFAVGVYGPEERLDFGLIRNLQMLDQITPVLLTYNEEQNIGRTLSRLSWAKDIVVVDSGSTDGTLAVLATFPNVRVFNRKFDTHANQWRYAVEATQITTDWILRLDADYPLTDAVVAELRQLDPDPCIGAYRARFDYAIFSRKLVSSLYPRIVVLLRKGRFSVWDRGHTEVWDVSGTVANLSARMIHDDWKPTSQWVMGQVRYVERELEWLRERKTGWTRWLRLTPPIMPIAAFLYCLFGKGLLFNGRAGMFYALQRMVTEAVLSLMVLEQRLREDATHSAHSSRRKD
jgi:Glycosyl transferase family 2